MRTLGAVFYVFFLPGLLMASWATRTPAIRDILSLSRSLKWAVFSLAPSIGSMSGLLGVVSETLWHA